MSRTTPPGLRLSALALKLIAAGITLAGVSAGWVFVNQSQRNQQAPLRPSVLPGDRVLAAAGAQTPDDTFIGPGVRQTATPAVTSTYVS
ncbi:MAG: hypothetical protein ACYDAY_07300 [Candidatus Dormibacteria bacterium]